MESLSVSVLTIMALSLQMMRAATQAYALTAANQTPQNRLIAVMDIGSKTLALDQTATVTTTMLL
jgi:hypothetical protein